jgi:hypothetical protein
MKKLIILSVLIIFYSCRAGKVENVTYHSSIIFGDCFNEDLVSLSVNGTCIFSDTELESDFSTGLTGVYLSKKK